MTINVASQTPPESPVLGDLWYDPVSGELKLYGQSSWEVIFTSSATQIVAQGSTKRTYAYLPDLPDHRDHLAPELTLTALPPKVDRLGLSVPIVDQGEIGACTGCSSTSALEITIKSATQLSRLMSYYDGRLYEGTTSTDAGAYLRDVVKGLTNYGVAPEAFWPYLTSRVTVKPSTAAYTAATLVKPLISSYQRVLTLSALKTALAAGHPVIFGFSAPQSIESETVASTGWLAFPVNGDPIIGGHAAAAVGYDDTASTPFVWVRNSWGTSWGINGYFKMPYQWWTDPSGMVSDMWTIVPKTTITTKNPHQT